MGVDDDDFAVLDVAHESRADDVERAGLGSQDRAAVEFAQHQRPDAEGIARADQLLVGERHERVGALDLGQRLDEPVDDFRPPRSRREQQDDLGVGRRLADGARADELAPQRQTVGQVAVVGDRQSARLELGEQRLHVAQRRLPGRRIADVADGAPARQPVDDGGAREVVADQALAALGMKALAVEGDDARRFLAAVLQGVQAERHDRRRVRVPIDPEDAAFLARTVLRQVEVAGRGVFGRHCFGAGAPGAPLMIASSFCLSDIDAGGEESAFFWAGAGAGVGGTAGATSFGGLDSSAGSSLAGVTFPCDLIHASIVAAASSGSMATILSAVSVRIGPCLCGLDPYRLLLVRHQPVENREGHDRQQEAARHPEHEPERPVERADLAVENGVRQPHGEQRNHDQRGEEHDRRARRLREDVLVDIGRQMGRHNGVEVIGRRRRRRPRGDRQHLAGKAAAASTGPPRRARSQERRGRDRMASRATLSMPRRKSARQVRHSLVRAPYSEGASRFVTPRAAPMAPMSGKRPNRT